MLDIERISEKIIEEKDNHVAKAFACHISNLLLANGIVPIMTEHRFKDLETITDSDRYELVYKLGITFDSLDTSKHDKEIYNQALDDFAEKLSNWCADEAYMTTINGILEVEILTIDNLIDMIFDLAERMKE